MTTKQAVSLALDVIGKNGFDGVACETTSLPEALRQNGLGNLSDSTFARVVAELRRQGLVEITKKGRTLKVQLSVKGIHRLQQHHIEKVSIAEPASWDKKWRMVTYDVPRELSAKRMLFTKQLRRLGFTMVRESVWFHPYPCFDKLNELVQFCGIARHVTFAEVTQLDTYSLARLQSESPFTARLT